MNKDKLFYKKNSIKLFLESKKRKAFLFFEKIDIKYYNLLQIDVLKNVADKLGFKKINDFFSSSYGNESMKIFRKLTIDTFGSSVEDPSIPDVEKIKSVYNSSKKDDVIQYMSSEILQILQ